MTNADLRMFMDDLKKIIHGNHHPLINNNPKILSKKPQFQVLYQDLESIIQILSDIHEEDHHHERHELEKVRNLKKRFKDATHEAQDSIDLFLSTLTIDFRDSRRFISAVYDYFRWLMLLVLLFKFISRLAGIFGIVLISWDLFRSVLCFENIGLSLISDVFKTSLDLEKILKSIESIKVELKTINISNMKMDSSSRIDQVKTRSVVAAAGTSYNRNPLGIKKPYEEFVVGRHHDVKIIWDKLTEATKELCVISIVGMGGIGKTTLAYKVFNDRFVVLHFHVRAWVTVSQSYKRRDLLIQVLKSIDSQQDLGHASDSQLRENLHKKLMGRRYLIVIDDIWSIEAWDELKVFFPHDNTSSRILLTTRLNEVALHVKPHEFVHSLRCLTVEESWELLKQKVFHGDECPKWLIEPGRKIAKKCQGLPLSVVVMAGVLAKEPMSKDLWEEIAWSIGSYHKGNLKTLALSYHHLPDQLSECFLYLGGFREDYTFIVENLIWLWVAEGFIEEDENRSLEDTAKAYLMELISRNLLIVARRNVIGDVEAFQIHDLVRELCLQKAKEERFFLKIDSLPLSSKLPLDILYQQRRVFTNEDISILNFTLFPAQTIRSLLCFHSKIHSIDVILHSFVLLKVLDLRIFRPLHFPEEVALLVHLRYLAIGCCYTFPKSICKLWRLQTLILLTFSQGIPLPREVQDMSNLRHLQSASMIYFPYIGKPMNLQSISRVKFKDGVDNLQKCFPNIKKLHLYSSKDEEYHFELLPYLETLEFTGLGSQRNHIWFPTTLKQLTLARCCLPWSDMSTIQSLPNLEVLQLYLNAFMGTQWDTREQKFPQLKLLILHDLDIKQWEAYSTSFPCLKRLVLQGCKDLEEIPFEIGEITTLEMIQVYSLSKGLVESVKRIQQEQHDAGNDELEITVNGVELSYVSEDEGSDSE